MAEDKTEQPPRPIDTFIVQGDVKIDGLKKRYDNDINPDLVKENPVDYPKSDNPKDSLRESIKFDIPKEKPINYSNTKQKPPEDPRAK